MSRFRKKPVVIEARQWNGENISELTAWGAPVSMGWHDKTTLLVRTLEDPPSHKDGASCEHLASLGDWIIRGVYGEFYPCKPNIFAATYEAVGDAAGVSAPLGDEGMCSHGQSDMTKRDWAAARLANAVELFLLHRDPSSLSALKQVFSEYRWAELGAP